jgi:hypothetical protein
MKVYRIEYGYNGLDQWVEVNRVEVATFTNQDEAAQYCNWRNQNNPVSVEYKAVAND